MYVLTLKKWSTKGLWFLRKMGWPQFILVYSPIPKFGKIFTNQFKTLRKFYELSDLSLRMRNKKNTQKNLIITITITVTRC